MSGPRNDRLVPLGVFVALLAVFVPFARFRLVDGDEGYLLLAAGLTQQGCLPYRDFFFPQGPVMPFAYAALLAPVGVNWYAGRTLSAMLAAGAGAFIALALHRMGMPRGIQILAAGLFAMTSIVFAWLPIAKTYGLSALLLTAAHAASLRPRGSSSAVGRGVIAGAALGLAVGARLYLVAVAPVVMLTFARSAGDMKRRALSVFALSFLVIALLCSIPPLADPVAGFHGILGYHLSRSDLSWPDALRQKLAVLSRLIGIDPGDRALGLQLAALLGISLLGLAVDRRVASRVGPGAALGSAVALVSLAPSRTFVQYFALAAPFLIETACLGVHTVLPWLFAHRRIRSAAIAAGVLYLSLGGLEAWRHTVTGAGVSGIGGRETPRWSLDAVQPVGRALDRYAGSGPVLASWPGFLVGSAARPWPGMENHFGPAAASRIPQAERRARLHLLSTADLEHLIRARRVPTVVVGQWETATFGPGAAIRLEAAGYRRAQEIGSAAIWTAEPARP